MTRALLRGRAAAVASGHPLATTAGLDVARAGGNAMDTAVAAAAALCVVLPQACGIGGDALFVVRPATGPPQAFHGAGRSPATLASTIPDDGPGTATVPGAVPALHAGHQRFGRLPFGTVMEPAIALASDGFPVTEQLILAIGRQRRRLERGAAGWVLLNGDLRPGATLRQLRLAALLRDIAADGPDALYTGPMAMAVATAARAGGGQLAEHDLAAHQTLVREPVTATRLGATMLVQPPPSQAALALVAMRALDELSPQDPVDRVHTAVEAIEAAFAHRDQLAADPTAEDVLAASPAIDMARAQRRGGPASPSHTTVVTAADADGAVVSMAISIFDEFGCATLVPEGGFLLNDRMLSFSRDPGSPNAARPGRLPVHTLSPVVARDARQIIAIATPGADGQVQTITQVADAVLAAGDSIPAALDRPRWRTTDGTLILEEGFDRNVATELAARGHQVSWLRAGDGAFESVVIAGVDLSTGTVFGSADLRRETAAGAR